MKRVYPILLFIFCLFSCLFSCLSDPEHSIEGNYIVKYNEFNGESDQYGIFWNRQILRIERDSVQIKNFPFQIFVDENDTEVHTYKLLGDTFLIFKKEKTDTFYYSIVHDTLGLVASNEKNVETFFEKIPSYQLRKKDSLFHEYLLESTFTLGDSVVIDFRKDASIMYSSLHFNSVQSWMVDKYGGELFLNLDGYSGGILHISHFDSSGFTGTYYGRDNRRMNFKKLNSKPKFVLKMLNGIWIDAEPSSDPPPQLWEDEYDYFVQEELVITDSTIKKYFGYSVSEFYWRSNINQDFLSLIKKNRPRYDKRTWQIFHLSENELIIDRVKDTRDYRIVERKIYKRK